MESNKFDALLERVIIIEAIVLLPIVLALCAICAFMVWSDALLLAK